MSKYVFDKELCETEKLLNNLKLKIDEKEKELRELKKGRETPILEN